MILYGDFELLFEPFGDLLGASLVPLVINDHSVDPLLTVHCVHANRAYFSIVVVSGSGRGCRSAQPSPR